MPSSPQMTRSEPSHRRRLVLPAVLVAVVAAAVLAFAAWTAKPAGSHPSEGQPCSRCHTQTLTTSLTLTLSKTSVATGGRVRLSGALAAGRSDQKITIKKSRNGTTWKVWKRVSLTSSLTYSATWTAPSTKGAYYFKARYPGDNKYKPCVSPRRKVTVK